MRSLARYIFLGLFIIWALPALAIEDTPQNRAQEAARYIQVLPPAIAVAGISDTMAESLPEAQRAPFLAAMKKDVNMAAINASAQAALVKVFTADELHALADFYGSPVVKSALEKMDSYTAEAMPGIMQQIEAVAAKAKQETAQQK